jgi:hypothetical protein
MHNLASAAAPILSARFMRRLIIFSARDATKARHSIASSN